MFLSRLTSPFLFKHSSSDSPKSYTALCEGHWAIAHTYSFQKWFCIAYNRKISLPWQLLRDLHNLDPTLPCKSITRYLESNCSNNGSITYQLCGPIKVTLISRYPSYAFAKGGLIIPHKASRFVIMGLVPSRRSTKRCYYSFIILHTISAQGCLPTVTNTPLTQCFPYSE